MLIQKYNPIDDTYQLGLVDMSDLSEGVVATISGRFAALLKFVHGVEQRMQDVCNTVRWEGCALPPVVPPASAIQLLFANEVLKGNTATNNPAWQFRAELPGVYHVSSYIDVRLLGMTSVNTPALMLYRNQEFWSYLEWDDRAGVTRFHLGGSDHIRLDCGDTMQIYLRTGPASATLNPSLIEAIYGYVGASWCGCCGDVVGDREDTLTPEPE